METGGPSRTTSTTSATTIPCGRLGNRWNARFSRMGWRPGRGGTVNSANDPPNSWTQIRCGAVAQARERYDIPIGALALNAQEYPDSASAHCELGKTLLATGRYGRAIESYSRASALASAEEEEEARVQWIRERLEVERHPVSLSPEQMQRVVGEFGSRHIRWEDGALFYRRDGNTEYRLIRWPKISSPSMV